MATLQSLLDEITACTRCAAHLPRGPRPIVRASAASRIAIVSQAPGTRAHESGIAFDDASGRRLRAWLDISDATFYDTQCVAIVPMGFCYPGRAGGGDAPPRRECRETWHPRLLPMLANVQLTLAIGQYAQAHVLGDRRRASLTDTVRAWRDFAPSLFPLPHPSPRNFGWFAANPWFDAEVVPALQARVREVLR